MLGAIIVATTSLSDKKLTFSPLPPVLHNCLTYVSPDSSK